MNLRALQQIDIDRSLSAAIGNSSCGSYSTRLQVEADQEDQRYIIVKYTRDTGVQRPPAVRRTRQPTILRARTVFPNSLLSTEICISLPLVDGISMSTCVMDTALQTNLHHRVFDPLPKSLGNHLYRSKTPLAVVVDDKDNLDRSEAYIFQKLNCILNGNSQSTGNETTHEIPCYIENSTQLGKNLEYRYYPEFRLLLYRLSHIYHRLNVIGKASIVICDAAGIAVDALKSSVPVGFISDVPSGFENLQAVFESFLLHGNFYQLLCEQKQELFKIWERQCHGHYVLSNQSTLQNLISRSVSCVEEPWLHNVNQGLTLNTKPQDSLILHTQQTISCQANNTVRLKSGLASNRRKLQKFRESPKRFMEDSQHRIFRSLAPGKVRW